MTAADVLELAKAAMLLLLAVAGPILIASLITGVAIGLLQALTQVQEMTLTFVPKLLVMGVVLLMCLPMMGRALAGFMAEISARIVSG
jgi:flagellar biosynthetic protein FliQ